MHCVLSLQRVSPGRHRHSRGWNRTVLLGVAERIIRGRAVSWPVAEGKIDSAPIEEFKGKRHHWTVRLNYSFLVYGKRYTGRYSRRFDYEDEAQSWAHHLQGKTVLVRHSPKWPPLSLILDGDLESVLNPSPPEPAQPADLPGVASVSLTKKLLAYPVWRLPPRGFW